MTNVPSVTWTTEGFIIPASAAVLDGVLADMNAAFGGVMNLSLSTPQGQLASSEAALVDYKNQIFLQYTQQVDPAYATGRMQDAIGRLYFQTRIAATSTTVTCTCTGLSGTVIPAGALAIATDGTQYTAVSGGTIPVGGSLSLAFAATVTGPITAPAGSVNQIYKAIPGWDTITNPADGTPGIDVETRDAFETRRGASVARNSLGGLPSVLAAVLDVSGVTDAYVTENTTDASATVGGVTLGPHSLYVAVEGGTNADVAKAIWSKKAPGCGYNGNTTITVYDTSTIYDHPLPSYAITFTRPTGVAIPFTVTLANSTAVPADVATQVQNAIIAAFSGLDGGPRVRIGEAVYASRFYSPVAALGSWARIVSIEIGSPLGNEVLINIDEIPTIAALDITVTLI
jgi:uncharacterized phage protein gp47/JayE